jgi:hypothetical protein
MSEDNNNNTEKQRETSVIKCTYCSKVYTRYLAGRYPNGKDKKWVDENGREFSGRTCPACHAGRAALNGRLRRQRMLKRWR